MNKHLGHTSKIIFIAFKRRGSSRNFSHSLSSIQYINTILFTLHNFHPWIHHVLVIENIILHLKRAYQKRGRRWRILWKFLTSFAQGQGKTQNARRNWNKYKHIFQRRKYLLHYHYYYHPLQYIYVTFCFVKMHQT